MKPHDQLPGEPDHAWGLFLRWLVGKNPDLDAYARSRRLDMQGTRELAMRWAWLSRRERYLGIRDVTSSLVLIEAEQHRDESALLAARATRDAMTAAQARTSTWAAQRGVAFEDRLVLAIMREHRQRQRDSKELGPIEVGAVSGELDLSEASPEELRTIILAKEIEARLRST